MAVHVDVHNNLLLAVHRSYQFSHQIHLRLATLFTTLPFSVQIASVSAESVVPLQHSVRVEYRDDLEQEIRTQHLAVLVVTD